MHVLVLIAFVIVLTLDPLTAPLAGGWVIGGSVAAYLAAAAGLSGLAARRAAAALAERPDNAAAIFRRHRALSLLTRFWLVGGLAALVLLGLGDRVREWLDVAGVPLVDTLAMFLPFAVALELSWAAEYPFYREVRRHAAARKADAPPIWTFGEYLDYNTRHYLLFVAVPVLLIIGIDEVWLLYLPPLLGEELAPYVIAPATLATALGVFLLAPLMIVRIWRTRRLEDGDLRRRLEETCERLKLRYRDILVWRSGGVIANAAVMGLLGPVRYVLLSDALLERMHPRQVESIFAHEAGHIVQHHIFYSALFAVASVTLVGLAADAAILLGLDLLTAHGLAMLALAVIWWLGFGWISRRFERQSDVIAAWSSGPEQAPTDGRITPEGAAVFARSLQEIARLNGIPASQGNWRHGAISWRISYVLWLGSTGGTRRRIDRLVRRIKLALWAAVIVAAVLTTVEILAVGRATPTTDGTQATEKGEVDERAGRDRDRRVERDRRGDGGAPGGEALRGGAGRPARG